MALNPYILTVAVIMLPVKHQRFAAMAYKLIITKPFQAWKHLYVGVCVQSHAIRLALLLTVSDSLSHSSKQFDPPDLNAKQPSLSYSLFLGRSLVYIVEQRIREICIGLLEIQMNFIDLRGMFTFF